MTAGDARRIAEEGEEVTEGCEHPDQCRRRASQLLDALDPKWDPRRSSQKKWEMPKDRREEFPKRVEPVREKEELFRIFSEGTSIRGGAAFEPKRQGNDQRQ
ncbi:hypothetical protein BDZ89DRAFT_1055034, partial [Hymenopellis radicata]